MGLFTKVKNIFREAADNAEKSLADTQRDGRYAIEDSKKEVQKLTTNIAELRAQTIQMERDLKVAEGKVVTMTNMATKAAQAGDAANAKLALQEKNTYQGTVNTLAKQIDQNNALYQNLLNQREQFTASIEQAKSNLANLTVREQSAKLRKNIANQSMGLAATDALSELKRLEEQVSQAEAEAEATEEIAGLDRPVEDQLEQLYGDGSGSGSVDDELAALMASVKK